MGSRDNFASGGHHLIAAADARFRVAIRGAVFARRTPEIEDLGAVNNSSKALAADRIVFIGLNKVALRALPDRLLMPDSTILRLAFCLPTHISSPIGFRM